MRQKCDNVGTKSPSSHVVPVRGIDSGSCDDDFWGVICSNKNEYHQKCIEMLDKLCYNGLSR